jgi:hypothetical protein
VLTNLSNTSGQPNSVVVIQQGLQVQPVVLVDQNGNAVTPGGGSGTATALATLTTPVVVSGATAPTTGQVLTAVSASVATWQNSTSGFSNPMTTAGDLIDATTGGAAQRLGIGTVGQVLTVSSGTAPAWGVASLTGGGTGGTSATTAYNNLSPMTTTGDIEYESAANTAARLAGNTTTTKKFLTGTGTGAAAQAPAWGTIATTDVPTLNQNTSGSAATSGLAANLSGGATLPDYLAPAVVTLSFVGSGTTLVNAASGNDFRLTLTASTTTLGNPSNPVDGQTIKSQITQGTGGSFTLAYGSAYDFGAAGSPTLSTTAAKVDVLGFVYNAALSKWIYLGSALGN